MPKGRVYGLGCKAITKGYVGSTQLTLEERLRNHKKRYDEWKAGKADYTTSLQIMAHDDAHIFLLEEIDLPDDIVKAVDVLRQAEQQWIEAFGEDCVNKRMAYWHDDDKKAYVKANNRRQYVKNVEARRAYQREYRLTNLDATRAAVRKWQEANREYTRQQQRERNKKARTGQ
jgi:hypothetical protein